MKSALIIIKNQTELSLLNQKILGKPLINIIIDEIKKAEVNNIFVTGINPNNSRLEYIESFNYFAEQISSTNGKTLVISPLYPFISASIIYEAFENCSKALVIESEAKPLDIQVVVNKDILNLTRYDYASLHIDQKDSLKVESLSDVLKVNSIMKKRINKRLIQNGVSILDIDNTYISMDAHIESGVTIYPNVVIENKSVIKKGTVITSNSYLSNVYIEEDVKIDSSHIVDSIIHSNVDIGPMSRLRMNCEIFSNAHIGNFVEFKNVSFGQNSKCSHLTYLGDATVGQGVNIGCGVVTVNYDGANKHKTIIEDKAFVGSNSNLIAPITIGKNVVVAAGSTITKSVENDAMIIERSNPVVKPGYGYTYIHKEKQ